MAEECVAAIQFDQYCDLLQTTGRSVLEGYLRLRLKMPVRQLMTTATLLTIFEVLLEPVSLLIHQTHSHS